MIVSIDLSCRRVAMRHHDSDRRALVLRVDTDAKGAKRYDGAGRALPTPPPPSRPFTEGGATFEELAEATEKPPVEERPDKPWVRSAGE